MLRPVVILMLAIGLLAGCSAAGRVPASTESNGQAEAQKIAELQAENHQRQKQNEELTEKLSRTEEELGRAIQEIQSLKELLDNTHKTLKAALPSPGYEATFRLVYTSLHRGDSEPLRLLLPTNEPFETGIRLGNADTYRQHDPGREVDLTPYAGWAKNHPLDSASIEVVATMPGYAWVNARFPDETYFRLFFSGWHVTKIRISDTPPQYS